MKTDEILTLFDYNYWANRRILDAAVQVVPEKVVLPVSLSWGSVHGTLVHTLSAEWIWRVRCQEGGSPTGLLDATEFPTLDSLRQRWDEEEQAMRAYLGSLSDEQLAQTIDYKNTRGQAYSMVLWSILVHVVNHGTQHRAEVAHFLTEFGQSPGDIDFSIYLQNCAPSAR
jgi:uncharacterized damage-inducible protein DinB